MSKNIDLSIFETINKELKKAEPEPGFGTLTVTSIEFTVDKEKKPVCWVRSLEYTDIRVSLKMTGYFRNLASQLGIDVSKGIDAKVIKAFSEVNGKTVSTNFIPNGTWVNADFSTKVRADIVG